ncbi:hypothetical protein PIGHUM_01214 [Pigmentiphaga humi]|uniref:Transferrin-binding protein B C-lobe/N-lobe beta barrel domain-containing protein n=1 Tax=Pigmentiphaga humi TaxID=2478468 RepID=A0A3P4AYK4_9BURK|nr:hypothetical protein [Pigmentiphaga humi]VCU69154.1 hypothetical protein PIGHUM_01214 [Pigmentiphaga humi]
MKHTVIALAILAASGAAQAQTVSGSVNTGSQLVVVGGATIGGFHGPLGAPGIGAYDGDNDPTNDQLISLQSIEPFTRQTTLDVVEGGLTFAYYQLPSGFAHPPVPGGGTPPATTVDMNGVKVPNLTKNVYFGMASSGTAGVGTVEHEAWFVGDTTGRVLPAAATNYATVALLGLTGATTNDGTSLDVLQGTLSLGTPTGGAASTASLTGTLSKSATSQYLDINAVATLSGAGAGTFAGNATYYVTTPVAANGTTSGQFFGNASSTTPGTDGSALAGVASGSYLGTDYVASFGGRAN